MSGKEVFQYPCIVKVAGAIHCREERNEKDGKCIQDYEEKEHVSLYGEWYAFEDFYHRFVKWLRVFHSRLFLSAFLNENNKTSIRSDKCFKISFRNPNSPFSQ